MNVFWARHPKWGQHLFAFSPMSEWTWLFDQVTKLPVLVSRYDLIKDGWKFE